jgi:hypothetical protein
MAAPTCKENSQLTQQPVQQPGGGATATNTPSLQPQNNHYALHKRLHVVAKGSARTSE